MKIKYPINGKYATLGDIIHNFAKYATYQPTENDEESTLFVGPNNLFHQFVCDETRDINSVNNIIIKKPYEIVWFDNIYSTTEYDATENHMKIIQAQDSSIYNFDRYIKAKDVRDRDFVLYEGFPFRFIIPETIIIPTDDKDPYNDNNRYLYNYKTREGGATVIFALTYILDILNKFVDNNEVFDYNKFVGAVGDQSYNKKMLNISTILFNSQGEFAYNDNSYYSIFNISETDAIKLHIFTKVVLENNNNDIYNATIEKHKFFLHPNAYEYLGSFIWTYKHVQYKNYTTTHFTERILEYKQNNIINDIKVLADEVLFPIKDEEIIPLLPINIDIKDLTKEQKNVYKDELREQIYYKNYNDKLNNDYYKFLYFINIFLNSQRFFVSRVNGFEYKNVSNKTYAINESVLRCDLTLRDIIESITIVSAQHLKSSALPAGPLDKNTEIAIELIYNVKYKSSQNETTNIKSTLKLTLNDIYTYGKNAEEDNVWIKAVYTDVDDPLSKISLNQTELINQTFSGEKIYSYGTDSVRQSINDTLSNYSDCSLKNYTWPNTINLQCIDENDFINKTSDENMVEYTCIQKLNESNYYKNDMGMGYYLRIKNRISKSSEDNSTYYINIPLFRKHNYYYTKQYNNNEYFINKTSFEYSDSLWSNLTLLNVNINLFNYNLFIDQYGWQQCNLQINKKTFNIIYDVLQLTKSSIRLTNNTNFKKLYLNPKTYKEDKIYASFYHEFSGEQNEEDNQDFKLFYIGIDNDGKLKIAEAFADGNYACQYDNYYYQYYIDLYTLTNYVNQSSIYNKYFFALVNIHKGTDGKYEYIKNNVYCFLYDFYKDNRTNIHNITSDYETYAIIIYGPDCMVHTEIYSGDEDTYSTLCNLYGNYYLTLQANSERGSDTMYDDHDNINYVSNDIIYVYFALYNKYYFYEITNVHNYNDNLQAHTFTLDTQQLNIDNPTIMQIRGSSTPTYMSGSPSDFYFSVNKRIYVLSYQCISEIKSEVDSIQSIYKLPFIIVKDYGLDLYEQNETLTKDNIIINNNVLTLNKDNNDLYKCFTSDDDTEYKVELFGFKIPDYDISQLDNNYIYINGEDPTHIYNIFEYEIPNKYEEGNSVNNSQLTLKLKVGIIEFPYGYGCNNSIADDNIEWQDVEYNSENKSNIKQPILLKLLSNNVNMLYVKGTVEYITHKFTLTILKDNIDDAAKKYIYNNLLINNERWANNSNIITREYYIKYNSYIYISLPAHPNLDIDVSSTGLIGNFTMDEYNLHINTGGSKYIHYSGFVTQLFDLEVRPGSNYFLRPIQMYTEDLTITIDSATITITRINIKIRYNESAENNLDININDNINYIDFKNDLKTDNDSNVVYILDEDENLQDIILKNKEFSLTGDQLVIFNTTYNVFIYFDGYKPKKFNYKKTEYYSLGDLWFFAFENDDNYSKTLNIEIKKGN